MAGSRFPIPVRNHDNLVHAAEDAKEWIGRVRALSNLIEINLRGSRNYSRRSTEANRFHSFRELHVVGGDVRVQLFLGEYSGGLIRMRRAAIRLNAAQLLLYAGKFGSGRRREAGQRNPHHQGNRGEYFHGFNEARAEVVAS